MAQEVAGSSPVYHPIFCFSAHPALGFGRFLFLRKTPCVKGICKNTPVPEDSPEKAASRRSGA